MCMDKAFYVSNFSYLMCAKIYSGMAYGVVLDCFDLADMGIPYA